MSDNDDDYDDGGDDKIKLKKSKTRGDYVRWSHQEIEAIKRSLGRFIALRKIPQKHDCLLAMKNEPVLKNREWKKLKFQVANLIKKKFY